MSNIKDIYQPLYAAIEEYKRINKKLNERKDLLQYLNDKADKKKDRRNKIFDHYLEKIINKKKKVRKKIIKDIVSNILGVLLADIFLGFFFPLDALLISVEVIMLIAVSGVCNYKSIINLIGISKSANMLFRYKNERRDMEEKNVGETLDILAFEVHQLSQRKKDLHDYIIDCEKRLDLENIKMANEILQVHNIDASVEPKIKMKQLCYNDDEMERKGLTYECIKKVL
ncbi:MAG: hypothetical protein K2G03_06565 [Bacilli bacterium]|nr:hypothetical protein [Bacilli bacterium]